MQDGTPKLAPRIIRSYRHSFVMVHVNVSLRKTDISCFMNGRRRSLWKNPQESTFTLSSDQLSW